MANDKIGAGLVAGILQLLFALFLILYGFLGMQDKREEDSRAFGEYQNLEDCIARNWNKRDPEQYCRKIRSKVEIARRRKYAN